MSPAKQYGQYDQQLYIILSTLYYSRIGYRISIEQKYSKKDQLQWIQIIYTLVTKGRCAPASFRILGQS